MNGRIINSVTKLHLFWLFLLSQLMRVTLKLHHIKNNNESQSQNEILNRKEQHKL
jgi:hypothetical protein